MLTRKLAAARDPSSWEPRAPRQDSALVVEVSGPTVQPFRSRVRNVSTSGMLIDSPHALQVGDVLAAAMPGAGEVMCVVVRFRRGAAGVRFLHGVDDSQAAAWSL